MSMVSRPIPLRNGWIGSQISRVLCQHKTDRSNLTEKSLELDRESLTKLADRIVMPDFKSTDSL